MIMVMTVWQTLFWMDFYNITDEQRDSIRFDIPDPRSGTKDHAAHHARRLLQWRRDQTRAFQRLTIRKTIFIEVRDSLKAHRNIRSYIYTKGVFYIHIIESSSFSYINAYLQAYLQTIQKRPALVNTIRVVHQSYENVQGYFKGTDCDSNQQAGPILTETEKTEEQIQDRSFEIYDLFMEGAKKRSENPAHRIGNMILLSNDDMAILISNRFMSLAEYINLYTGELNVDREQEFSYPLPPSFFHVMEFLEVDDYQQFIVNWQNDQALIVRAKSLLKSLNQNPFTFLHNSKVSLCVYWDELLHKLPKLNFSLYL